MSLLNHRREIRLAELAAITPYLPARGRLLEIGAGAGWQARMLAELGFEVTAIDVSLDRTDYNALRSVSVFPITEFDGRTIPAAAQRFDVVFTSNTLLHIPDLEHALAEIRRVLKDDGKAVHVLPTSTWRVATLCAHFVNFRLIGIAWNRMRHSGAQRSTGAASAPGALKWGLAGKFFRQALPRRLGERGNAISEVSLFSEHNWTDVFRRAGFVVEGVKPCGVFNTGHHLLGPVLPVRWRQKMAAILGSSCKAYFLAKPKPKACDGSHDFLTTPTNATSPQP